MLNEQQLNDPESQDQESENLLVASSDDAIKELLGGSYDKFKGEDGKLDTSKLAKSYAGLEKKLGSGDLAPDSIDGYGMPEAMPEGVDKDKLAEGLKELYSELHAVGATKKVVDVVTNKYLGLITKGSELQAGESARQKGAVEAELKASWGDKFEENVGLARKAFNRLATDEDKAAISELGGNAKVMKFLARIGAGFKEDAPVNAHGNPLNEGDLNSLMKSEAYWNSKHPDHLKTKQAVTNHFSSKTY